MKTNGPRAFMAAILIAIAGMFSGKTQAQPFLTNGLVAYFPFSGNANDASGNTNNGTLFGSATFGVDRFGNSNSCLSLPGGPGVGSGVDVPSLDNIPFYPITYTAWFLLKGYLPVQSLAQAPILGRQQCGDQFGGALCLMSQGSRTNTFDYNTGANNYYTSLVVPTNQWCQVVMTIDASNNATIYFNGTNLPGGGATPAGTPLDFRIGAAGNTGCNPIPDYFVWNGFLDDIRIYNRALSSNEVEALYQYEAPTCSSAANAVALITNGFVIGADIVNSGCGYTNVPSVTIIGGGGSGAMAQAVVTAGSVTQINITATGSNYTSAPAIVIGGIPVIVTQPETVTVNAFQSAAFQGLAYGSDLSYQWIFDGTNIVDSSNIIGATFPVLSISNVVQTNLGSYALVASNPLGSVTSSVVQLQMYPYLEAPFSGLDTLWGYTNTLSVDAWGSGMLDYQWFDDGVPIAGATNSTLTFTGIQPTNSGTYTVVVSNSVGSVTNMPEQVVVQPSGVGLGLYPGITITGVAGQTYTIQRTPSLSDTNWVTLTNVTLTQPVQMWFDGSLNAEEPANAMQYYRVLPGP